MSNQPKLTTEELARVCRIKATSVHARFCRTNSYYGLRPERLPNGRLLWPADSEQRLLAGGRGTHRDAAADAEPRPDITHLGPAVVKGAVLAHPLFSAAGDPR